MDKPTGSAIRRPLTLCSSVLLGEPYRLQNWWDGAPKSFFSAITWLPVLTFLFFWPAFSSALEESHVCASVVNETKRGSAGTASWCLNTAPTLAATHHHQHDCTAPGSHTTWHTDLFCWLVWTFPLLRNCHWLCGLHHGAGQDRKTIKEKQERTKVGKEVLASFLAVKLCKRWRRPREKKGCAVEWGSASC